MKNFIIGLALILFAAVFLVFQSDINMYQRQMDYVYDVAEEAAATAALEIVLGDDTDSQYTQTYANGFIKFEDNAADAAAREIVKKGLKLDSAYQSSSRYFSDNMTITVFLFSQDGTYSKFVNGTKTVSSALFTYGENLSIYCDSPYQERIAARTGSKEIIINYPSAVCIIDAGKPKFNDSFGLRDMAKDILEVGVYEYKHFRA